MNSLKIIKLQSYINVPTDIIQHCTRISLYATVLLFRYSSHCFFFYTSLCKTITTLYMQPPLISQVHKLQYVSTLLFLPFKYFPLSPACTLQFTHTHLRTVLHCHQQCIIKYLYACHTVLKKQQQNNHLWCVLQILKTTDLKNCFYLTVQQLIKFHYVLMKYA